MSKPPSPLTKRFWAKVDERGPDDCWEWMGNRNAKGYGMFYLRGRHTSINAHRMAYILTTAEMIPDELTIDHQCNNPPCCNPRHLKVVTMRVNNLRSDGIAANNARKTHCIHGHEFTPDNIRWRRQPNGHFERECRACRSRRKAEQNARLKAARALTRPATGHRDDTGRGET